MSENLIRLPLLDEDRKPAATFRTGSTAGRKLRKIFWLTERYWCSDSVESDDSAELSCDEFLERLRADIATLIHWMLAQVSFDGGHAGTLKQTLDGCASAMQTFLHPSISAVVLNTPHAAPPTCRQRNVLCNRLCEISRLQRISE